VERKRRKERPWATDKKSEQQQQQEEKDDEVGTSVGGTGPTSRHGTARHSEA